MKITGENMTIHPTACEFLMLGIFTDPVSMPTSWEASIDNGATWIASREVEGLSAWLVAGNRYDGPETVSFRVADSVSVLVRHVDAPETTVRYATKVLVSRKPNG